MGVAMGTATSHSGGEERKDNDQPQAQLHRQALDVPHDVSSSNFEPAPELHLDSDHDLSRIGFWSLSLGGLGVFIGITFFMAGGILPGTLVAALALPCTLFGAFALAVVAHHAG